MLRTDEGFIEVIYNLGAPQTERKTVVIFRAEARFHSLFNETTITIKGFVKNEAKQAWNWIEFNAS